MPARKRIKPPRPPKRPLPPPSFTEETKLLDHFKVYRAMPEVPPGEFPIAPFTLTDEFGDHRVHLISPSYFAVPVAKRKPHVCDLLHPTDAPHLTIYEINEKYSPDDEGHVIDVKDQITTLIGGRFGLGLQLDWSRRIGVPSKKVLAG